MMPTIATGWHSLLRPSSPFMLLLALLSRDTPLPLTHIQVKCLRQRAASRTRTCILRMVTVEVCITQCCRLLSIFASPSCCLLQPVSNLVVSPAGQGAQQPQGYPAQGQQYGETPNSRTSVPPPSVPTPSSGATKRRSDQDDDRHTPTDRHSRPPPRR